MLIKLFRDEPDSPLAKAAVIHCAERGIAHLAPGLALYEVLSVALHYGVPFDIPVRLIAALKKTGFRFIEPNAEDLNKAEAIATTKTSAHGFPALADSIYHAMAIVRNGNFLTADKRHFDRTRTFGGVQLLAEWRPD